MKIHVKIELRYFCIHKMDRNNYKQILSGTLLEFF